MKIKKRFTCKWIKRDQIKGVSIFLEETQEIVEIKAQKYIDANPLKFDKFEIVKGQVDYKL